MQQQNRTTETLQRRRHACSTSRLTGGRSHRALPRPNMLTRSRSRTMTLVVTLPPASRQILAATLTKANRRRLPSSPKTLGCVSFSRCGDPNLPTTTALSLSLELCQLAPGPTAKWNRDTATALPSWAVANADVAAGCRARMWLLARADAQCNRISHALCTSWTLGIRFKRVCCSSNTVCKLPGQKISVSKRGSSHFDFLFICTPLARHVHQVHSTV